MADLSVKYMGLALSSPVIVASSGLTAETDKVVEAEKAGAGAVVVKSLFEEQIYNEAQHMLENGSDYPGADDYIRHFVRQNTLGSYCSTIRNLKAAVRIPVIGSINCYSDGEWISYAKEIEAAGADALELNLYSMPLTLDRPSSDIEDEDIRLIKKVVSSVSIPVSVKISSSFTSVPNFVDRLKSVGVKAVVMFNRFYMPDIDLDSMTLVSSDPLSSGDEYIRELRSVAIVSSLVKGMDIAATTGIHTPQTAMKEILAGATAVQLCSVLFKSGMGIISEFNSFISSYIDGKGYPSVSEICGRLNYSSIQNPDKFERTQFVKVFGSRK